MLQGDSQTVGGTEFSSSRCYVTRNDDTATKFYEIARQFAKKELGFNEKEDCTGSIKWWTGLYLVWRLSPQPRIPRFNRV